MLVSSYIRGCHIFKQRLCQIKAHYTQHGVFGTGWIKLELVPVSIYPSTWSGMKADKGASFIRAIPKIPCSVNGPKNLKILASILVMLLQM